MTEPGTLGSRHRTLSPTSLAVRSGVSTLQRAMAVASAVLVAIDAYVHFHDVHFYDLVGTSTLSAGNRFRAQAAAAVAVGIALIVRPRPVVWRSRYSQLPVPGPPCSPRTSTSAASARCQTSTSQRGPSRKSAPRCGGGDRDLPRDQRLRRGVGILQRRSRLSRTDCRRGVRARPGRRCDPGPRGAWDPSNGAMTNVSEDT